MGSARASGDPLNLIMIVVIFAMFLVPLAWDMIKIWRKPATRTSPTTTKENHDH